LQSGLLAGGSENSQIYIWAPDTGFCYKQIQEIGQVFCLLEFEPNKLLSGTSECNICLRDIYSTTDDFIFNFLGHENYVLCLVKCNNNIFASGGNDGTIRIWNYYQKIEIRKIDDGNNSILCLIKLKNGNLCSGGSDLSIKFWNWENGEFLNEIVKAHDEYIKCLCEIKENILLSGSDDNTIKIWKEYECCGVLEEHKNTVRALCKINNNYFASGSFDNKIKIWDFKNMKCIQTLEGHYSNVNAVIKLKNNSLASCSMDKTIKICEQK
jgi:WD40 repeat protein